MQDQQTLHQNVVITVTYGARWHLLRQALASAREEGFNKAIIVDNGAREDIAALAKSEFGDFAEVLVMGRNTGSAGGFKAGMERALQMDAEYLLLLDDDNVLQSGCLQALQTAHGRCANSVALQNLSVLAYRDNLYADVVANVSKSGMDGNRAAFLGFHCADVPYKLFRRTGWGKRWIAQRPALQQASLAIAPYSGMYFHRSVLVHHGFPDERFLLYADDTDFSARITRAGGQIVLVPEAQLVDLEMSWHVKARFTNTLDALLMGDGDFRVFYSTRNNAYYEACANRDGSKFLRSFNRALYLGALKVRAIMKGRRERFALLLRAIREGERGRLGEHPDFPLSS